MAATLQEGSGRSKFDFKISPNHLTSSNPQTKSELEQAVNPSQPLFNAKLYRNVFLMWY